MKKLGALVAGLVLAVVTAVPAVSAHFTDTEHPHVDPNVTITAPTANSTVSTIFTLRGTVNPACSMDKVVSAQDNENGGYIETTPTQNAGTFAYSIDTSKVLTREGLDPYTLKSGKIAVYLFTDSDDPDCNPGYAELLLTLKHPGTPPPPAAVKKPIDIPSIQPSPLLSPSPPPAPLQESPAVAASFWEKLPTWAWLLIGAALGALLLGLIEWSAIRYRRKHGGRNVAKR